MRTYTLAFSIFVHMLVVAGIVVAPIVASDILPEPRRAIDYIIVRPVDPPPPPPPPPPPRSRRTEPSPSADPDRAPLEAPDTISKEAGIDRFELSGAGTGSDIPGVRGSIDGDFLIGEPAPPPPPPKPAPILRVGGSIRQPQKIRHVAPTYPALALASRKEGVVILEAVIGEDGRVRNLRVLRSIQLLDEAAMDAVRQWQFTPTLLNGEPVPVVMTVTVAFTLGR